MLIVVFLVGAPAGNTLEGVKDMLKNNPMTA